MQNLTSDVASAVNRLEGLAYAILENSDDEDTRLEYRAQLEDRLSLRLRDHGYIAAYIFRDTSQMEAEPDDLGCSCIQLEFSAVYSPDERNGSGIIQIKPDEMPLGGADNSIAEKTVLQSLCGVAETIHLPRGESHFIAHGNAPMAAMRHFASSAMPLLAEGARHETRLAQRGDTYLSSHQTTGSTIHDNNQRVYDPYLRVTIEDAEIEHEYVHDPVHGREVRTHFADPELRLSGLESAQPHPIGLAYKYSDLLAHEAYERSLGAYALTIEGLKQFIERLA